MSATEKMNNSENETLQLVLEEYTQEQANNTKAVNDLVAAFNALSAKFTEFQEKVDNPRAVNVSTDTRPIQDIMKKGIIDMRIVVGAKPQPVVKKYQILLFPEQDAKLFYKVVFGRWFLMLVLLLLTADVYRFSVHWSDNQKEVQVKELENDRVNKAWNYLYHQVDKPGRRFMDSAYVKSY